MKDEDHPNGPHWNDMCHSCNEDCGHEDRGHCVDDDCEVCGEWCENCGCEPEGEFEPGTLADVFTKEAPNA